MMEEQTFRAVWLSDVHLGARACRARLLLDFLKRTKCEVLYLVGDIIDLESMRSSFYWPPSHVDVLRLLLRKSQTGTRIVYIPGNHDDELRAMIGMRLGNIEILARTVHTTQLGKRMLVLHGDEFDTVVKCGGIALGIGLVVGSFAYRRLLTANRLVHWLRERFGLPYWSLAQHLKARFGKAQGYIAKFQQASLRAAAEAGLDGVICGHIHRADLLERDGLVYCNDGDWVESCTALTETTHGELELVTWRPKTAAKPVELPIQDAA
jgi:UDP-2,3-diacylglucosamine pyrophosphatase LpxH